MRKIIISFVVVLCLIPVKNNLAQKKTNSSVYQSAPLETLMKGEMNGNMTMTELKKHGNFGLGTFNGVNGEMIVLNGVVYQVKGNGKVDVPANSVKTPFCNVTFFKSDKTIELKDVMNYKEFIKYLNTKLPSKNLIYAIKVSGEFSSLKTRSENKQTKPYTNLAVVLKNQDVFSFKNIKGTMVGFKYPDYVGGINVNGYHFHFISNNKKEGGHVLDFKTENVKIEIDYINRLVTDISKN